MSDRPQGDVEAAVRADLEAAGQAGGALAQIAYALARVLDKGAGMAAAAVAKELRETLETLIPKESGDADDALARFFSGLPTTVRD